MEAGDMIGESEVVAFKDPPPKRIASPSDEAAPRSNPIYRASLILLRSGNRIRHC